MELPSPQSVCNEDAVIQIAEMPPTTPPMGIILPLPSFTSRDQMQSADTALEATIVTVTSTECTETTLQSVPTAEPTLYHLPSHFDRDRYFAPMELALSPNVGVVEPMDTTDTGTLHTIDTNTNGTTLSVPGHSGNEHSMDMLPEDESPRTPEAPMADSAYFSTDCMEKEDRDEKGADTVDPDYRQNVVTFKMDKTGNMDT